MMVAVFISHGGDKGNGDVVVMVLMVVEIVVASLRVAVPMSLVITGMLVLVMPVTVDDVTGW